jgi:hypothetical protein
MTRLHPTSGTNSFENIPACRKQMLARASQAWLTALTIACVWATVTDVRAGNPVAEAQWYCPYTPEGNCAPYTRSYGYTPTRWRKWPAVMNAKPAPEAVVTPRAAVPTEAAEDMPEPDTSHKPGRTTEEQPGPSTDDSDSAPAPPTNFDPAMPSDLNNDSDVPSADLDDLFPDESSSTKGKPAKPKSTKAPDTDAPTTDDADPTDAPAEEKPQSRRGGGRQASFTSAAEPKMLWRRSKRVSPSDVWTTHDSSGDVDSSPASGQPAAGAGPTMRLTSNPLRDSRVTPAADTQWQSLAGSDTVPTAAVSTASPAWRANPLRDRQ